MIKGILWFKRLRTIARPDVKERIMNAGLETVGGMPEELAVVVKEEIAQRGKVIRNGGIREE